MPNAKRKLINLIPQDEFESSNFGRLLKWALSTFRFIVIVTELIVMSAFLSRFWLDARNSDLNEEINISKSQVQAYEKIEKKFRLIQQKTTTAKEIYNEAKNSKIFTEISASMPENIVLNSVTIEDNVLTIKANSFSERPVAQFIFNLEKSSSLKSVILQQVASNTEGESTILYTISALLDLGGKE